LKDRGIVWWKKRNRSFGRAWMVMMLVGMVAMGAVAAEKKEAKQMEKPKLKISLTSIIVTDQARALTFYTEVLGFVKKVDVPVGKYRWITVVAPDNPDGTQLVLEPNANEAARVFQAALKKQGIPATAFEVDDVKATYELLKGRGVAFTVTPTRMGDTTLAVFDDTCGNLIQIYEAPKETDKAE